MKNKIFKYCNLFNVFILNLFAAGFILNAVSFTQTNWIRNDNYVYGVFQYCTANQIIKLEATDSFSFYDQIEVIYRKYTSDSDDIRCFRWSKYTTPAFINLSFLIQILALASHLSFMAVIVALKIVNHKLLSCYKRRYKDKAFKNIKDSCCFKVSYHIAWNFFFCFMSTTITALYGGNLILFQYHQNLTNIKINNESLSWCYWLSLAGTTATFLSTCGLFVYTIYFKILNNGESRKFKYSLKYFIDAYKKCNGPFYSLNFEENFGSPVPRASCVDFDNINNEPEMKATRTTGTETNEGNNNNIYDNTGNDNKSTHGKSDNVFFRRNPDLEGDDLKDNETANITHKSEIIDCNKSFNSENESSKVQENDEEKKSSSSSQQPSSFIYSQVYPCGKREKNTKDAPPLKMVVLPFGSLSGNCANGSNNSVIANENEREEKLPEVREKII